MHTILACGCTYKHSMFVKKRMINVAGGERGRESMAATRTFFGKSPSSG